MKLDDFSEGWSKKYKKSIDCSNPKGFSQRAHCAGRKKKNEGKGYNKMVITPHQNLPSTNTPFGGTTMVGKGFRDQEKAQAKTQTAVDQRQGAGMSRIGVFKNIDKTDFSPEVFPRRKTPKPARESLVLEDGWWDAYEKIRDSGDDIAPYLKSVGYDPYSKSDVMKFIDKNLSGNQGLVKMAMDAPAWMISSMAANAGIDAQELKSMIAARNQYKKDNPGFAKDFRDDPVTTWQNIKSEAIRELKIEKPDSVDTKGVKRVEMPQIHKDDYNEFIDYLQDNGAKFTKQTMPAKSLKATQGEFSDKGVEKQIRKYIKGEPKKPVIASQDNFIIDGHHRWLVAWNTGDTLEVYKVNIDADDLLKLVKNFPKTTYKDIYNEELYDFDKDKPMKSTVAVPGYGTMSIDGLMQNLIQSVTELLGRMKQGTDGMRRADYELNRNKVLTTKLSALIQALDDLQAIRKKGGSNSRNIQKEQEEEQQQEMPVDTNQIFNKIQEFESNQFISPQDADFMRRAIQSLTVRRQTVYPEAILKLLTFVTQ